MTAATEGGVIQPEEVKSAGLLRRKGRLLAATSSGLFNAEEALFRTGWFIESIATQVLVIFVIRTRGVPWRSRPNARLVVTALGVVSLAVCLPFTPLAQLLGFVAPPPALLLAIAAMTLLYLGCAELAKRWFYRVGSGKSKKKIL